MPFLKRYKPSLTALIELRSQKNGLRFKVFNANTTYFNGVWKENRKNGWGYLVTNKSKYEGNWKVDKRHGYGQISRKRTDGSYNLNYEGKWKNGKKHGPGVRYYDDGSIYQGDWFNGNRHGYGRLWYSDGSFYNGQWYKDKRHGQGLFVYSNGNRYEGEWSKGLKNGKGLFYHLCTGQEQEGQWLNDKCVNSVMRDSSYRQSACAPTPYSIPLLRVVPSLTIQ